MPPAGGAGLGLGPSVEAEQGSGGRARAGDSDGAVMAGRDEAHEVPKATLIFRSSRRGRARLSGISSSLAHSRARATERVLLVLVIVFFSERRTGILRVCARTGRKERLENEGAYDGRGALGLGGPVE